MPRSLNANTHWILTETNDLLKGCDPSSIPCWMTKITNQTHQRKGSKAKIVINRIYPSGTANSLSSSNCVFEDDAHINQLLFEYSLKKNNLFFNGAILLLQNHDSNDNKDIAENNNGLHVDNKLVDDCLQGHAI